MTDPTNVEPSQADGCNFFEKVRNVKPARLTLRPETPIA